MLQAPCKDCKDRQLHCHSICEKYLAFQKDNEALREKKRKEQSQRSFDIDRAIRLQRKAKSRRGNR